MDTPRLKPNTKATKTSELPPPLATPEVSSKPEVPFKTTAKTPAKTETEALARLLEQYEYGPIEFAGSSNASYERHLVFDNVNSVQATGPRERFEAFARSVRDILSQRWVRTEDTYAGSNPKRVYYLSM
jgi:starch phosphorylase